MVKSADLPTAVPTMEETGSLTADTVMELSEERPFQEDTGSKYLGMEL